MRCAGASATGADPVRDAASLPFWPRRLSADLAAAYLGISRSTFLLGVDDGTWPEPIRDGRRTLWDRLALDRIVDGQSGITDLPAAGPDEPGHGWGHVAGWAGSN